MENFDGGLTCSSLVPPADEVDDISVFVKQILLRSSLAKNSNFSSSSSTISLGPPTCNAALEDNLINGSGSDQMISRLGSSSGLNSASIDGYCPYKSLCFGVVDNEMDGYHGESEVGFFVEDEFLEEVPNNINPQRGSSKRSRAAEIHNLSEKRRRSRINEKMKALQNLIPNSNKTDKASMLDEAIEYLKQLQLQVQMLTMRNGFSLYPGCLPGVVHQDRFSEMKTGYVEENGPLNTSTSGSEPATQGLLESLPNIYKPSNRIPVSNCSPVIDVANPFRLETSHLGSSSNTYQGIQRQEKSGLGLINEGYPTRNLTEYSVGQMTPSMDENITFLLGKRQSEYARLKELEHKAMVPPLMKSTGIHRSLHIKKELNEL